MGPPSSGGALTDVHEEDGDDDDYDDDDDDGYSDDEGNVGALTQAKLPLVGASFSWCRGSSVLPARGADV